MLSVSAEALLSTSMMRHQSPTADDPTLHKQPGLDISNQGWRFTFQKTCSFTHLLQCEPDQLMLLPESLRSEVPHGAQSSYLGCDIAFRLRWLMVHIEEPDHILIRRTPGCQVWRCRNEHGCALVLKNVKFFFSFCQLFIHFQGPGAIRRQI